MDDVDKALTALKMHIKKEIVDNYFADRVYVEEDTELLRQEVQEYAQGMTGLGRRFMALYHALGSPNACALVMEVLGIKDWPFYQEYLNLPPSEQQDLLKGVRSHGLTAFRRFRHLIFDLYERLQREGLEGGREESMTGGLLSTEREELSTRMRFKRQKLTDEQLPPVPVLPPLAEIKGKLTALLDRIYAP
jgi:hypothetical protein